MSTSEANKPTTFTKPQMKEILHQVKITTKEVLMDQKKKDDDLKMKKHNIAKEKKLEKINIEKEKQLKNLEFWADIVVNTIDDDLDSTEYRFAMKSRPDVVAYVLEETTKLMNGLRKISGCADIDPNRRGRSHFRKMLKNFGDIEDEVETDSDVDVDELNEN